MKRNTWTFEYTAADVREAAKAKMIHHRDRQTWWEKKQKEVVAEARKSGLSINEAIGAEYAISNTIRGAHLVVDNKIQSKLNECFMKIQEHRAKKEEYAGWMEVLKSRGQTLFLEADDYLYFFGEK